MRKSAKQSVSTQNVTQNIDANIPYFFLACFRKTVIITRYKDLSLSGLLVRANLLIPLY